MIAHVNVSHTVQIVYFLHGHASDKKNKQQKRVSDTSLKNM
jgi:hypothetical protein